MIREYIKLLRPEQYTKNLFIFLPVFFGIKINDINILLNCFYAFLIFSLVASSIYIFNDIFDAEDDKKHPVKKNRPIASGKISIKSAYIILILLLLISLPLTYFLNHEVFYLILLYIILNIGYTIRLKHIAIIDIFIISSGFIIRLYIGSAISEISLSVWIEVMTFLLALFISLAKRRDDVIIYNVKGDKTRKVIDGYNLEFLNVSMIMMASVTILSYLMYTVSPEVINRINNPRLYTTAIWVMLGILRYMQIAFVKNDSGSPTAILLKDRFIQLTLIAWIINFWIIIY
jgi:decaprenyl-phosphate phosphoribosyltransferase